jgi:hypothetical protein
VIRRGDDVDDTGGMSVRSAISRPSRVALNGVFGSRLEHDGVAGGQRLPELVDRHLEREVPRHDGADHADRLAPDLAGCQLRR